MKSSAIFRYYAFFFVELLLLWGILSLLSVEFYNIVFFMLAYIWHLTLLTPKLRDQVLTTHNRFSFLSVVIKLNYYLMIFINKKNNPIISSIIRALSPFMFITLINSLGGYGNLYWVVFGSVIIELSYIIYKRFIEIKDNSAIADIINPETR